MNLSINETNIEGLDGVPNIDHVKKIIDGKKISMDSDPLDRFPTRPVPSPSASHQGPNHLGGVGVPNGTQLYGVIHTLRGRTVHY